jgi:protein-S-isoprenylcysteine O-methyltransferase Ste14
MSLVNNWISLVFRVATGNWKTKLLFAPIVGLFFLGFIASFVFLSFITDQSLHFPKAVYLPWSPVVGVALIVFGFFLTLISMVYFVKVKGTPVPLSPPPTLVITGPYKFVRNPMLTGIFMQLFGIGITFGSISLILFFTPCFIIINVWELKKVEEPELAKRLGEEYVEYKKRVPMFFPFLKKT